MAPGAYEVSLARRRMGAATGPDTTATANLDPSHICDLPHSLRQHQILNPVSEARNWIYILMQTRQVLNLLSHNGNAYIFFFFFKDYTYVWYHMTLVTGHFFFSFLGPNRYMEVPRLGVESELWLLAYATATAIAMSEMGHICNLHHSW